MDDLYSASQVIERTWRAPLDVVWQLWTTPDGIESWLGPDGFRATVLKLELKTGGAFDYQMAAVGEQTRAWMEANGRPLSWPCLSVFTEVVPKTRLVFVSEVPMGPDVPNGKMNHIVELREDGEHVHLTLTLQGQVPEMLAGAAKGFSISMDKLGALL